MHKIVEILHIMNSGLDAKGKPRHRTYALLDNQNEYMGFGDNYKIGDEVESWFSDKYSIGRMQKPKKAID